MRKVLFVLFTIFTISAYSQSSSLPDKTNIENARYEIVQCPIARKYTIKIDKQTGQTWQMVLGLDNKLCWEKLFKGPTLQEDTIVDGKNNYIIFMGGTAVKDMFLMNVNTGACWQLVNDSSDGTNWWSSMLTF